MMPCPAVIPPGQRRVSFVFIDGASLIAKSQIGIVHTPRTDRISLRSDKYLARESNPVQRFRKPSCVHHTRKAGYFLVTKIERWVRIRINQFTKSASFFIQLLWRARVQGVEPRAPGLEAGCSPRSTLVITWGRK